MRTSAKAAIFVLLAPEALVGCEGMIRNGPIISGYENADCIPVQSGPGITPPMRAWDYTTATSTGLTVRILGAAAPGGQIVVRYIPEGTDIVAADAGDYIYPAVVRLDRGNGTLFIKASGITAAFSQPQTWLFEYDLNNRRQIARKRVDPSALPQECQIK
jgi:hypothetical protein